MPCLYVFKIKALTSVLGKGIRLIDPVLEENKNGGMPKRLRRIQHGAE